MLPYHILMCVELIAAKVGSGLFYTGWIMLHSLSVVTVLINAGIQMNGPCARDALLTRSVLALLAIENLRDAKTLLAGSFLKDIDGRSEDELKKSYLDKTDGKAPSHIIFVCKLIRIVKRIKTLVPSWVRCMNRR